MTRPPAPRTPADDERTAGRRARAEHPVDDLAAVGRVDGGAVEILTEQNAGRLPDLIGLRFARMLTDPFAFYRGSAAVMAADLAAGASSPIDVVACGDAHVANFGLFASPERELVFDLNDFDEACTAPFDWDLRRLATSVVVAGRHLGHSPAQVEAAAVATGRAYVASLRVLLGSDALTRHTWLARPEQSLERLDPQLSDLVARTARRARARTSQRVAARTTQPGPDGRPRFVENPPVLTHSFVDAQVEPAQAYRSYLRSVGPEIQLLLSQFTLADTARRVVGVGSVGTRCYLRLYTGPSGEPLVLQLKEATASVLTTYGGRAPGGVVAAAVRRRGEGARVAAAQRMMQAATDPFLGSMRHDGHDYYVRQFHDMKGSLDLTAMSPRAFADYGRVCAMLLARAHAQSPSAYRVAGYAGKGERLAAAVARFAHAYADKSAADFAELRRAADEHLVPVADSPAR